MSERRGQAKSALLGLGYLAFPFDLIPDFLPGIGHLDDVLIVGGLVWLALKFVPEEVLKDARSCETVGKGPIVQ
jgi:uncharacterized membrane protein YkvA (DUF1232 family)